MGKNTKDSVNRGRVLITDMFLYPASNVPCLLTENSCLTLLKIGYYFEILRPAKSRIIVKVALNPKCLPNPDLKYGIISILQGMNWHQLRDS